MKRCMLILACLFFGWFSHATMAADDPVYSGPQVGEKLTPFKVLGVYDGDAGKELDFVSAAAGKPLLLIFVHELTRPSMGVTRALTGYAKTRAKDGLSCGVVWLSADKSEAEQYLKRARNSLNIDAPVGISPEGIEGPGSYGLNRKVALTILVGKDNTVTANYALVQPSLTEAPKILADVVKLIGGDPPTLEQLQPTPAGRPNAPQQDPRFRELLSRVIKLTATEAEVKQGAAAVEAFVADNKARQQELGRIARTVVDSGKLANYGTPLAQEQLRKWAEKYGKKE